MPAQQDAERQTGVWAKRFARPMETCNANQRNDIWPSITDLRVVYGKQPQNQMSQSAIKLGELMSMNVDAALVAVAIAVASRACPRLIISCSIWERCRIVMFGLRWRDKAPPRADATNC